MLNRIPQEIYTVAKKMVRLIYVCYLNWTSTESEKKRLNSAFNTDVKTPKY